ncbi:choice-of-anchor M domain-containing protein [Dactylosporangium sp. CS-047395]|uniref:choice-of-anchor M domain-containing protein n=1 Tax=Dactylosporangium sp. CS-047395 TaxID=3239936 RepID=UPI003D8A7821
MRNRAGLRAVVATASAVAAVAVATPAHASPVTVISQGHVDAVDVGFENGHLEIVIHDERTEPGVELDPAKVLLVAKKQSKTQVPNDPAFSFLGTPGASVYLLPETQDPTLLWPGLSTEDIEPGVFRNDAVTIRFKQVIGPDGVSLFTFNPDGSPNKLVDSEDGLPDNVVLQAGAHVHENWAFEKSGEYKIKVDATAKLASTGATVTAPAVWITFCVQK